MFMPPQNKLPEQSPYTEHEHPHNVKPREVYCETCKYTITTDLPGPKCGVCRMALITVVKSQFDELQLGQRDSGPSQ